MFDELQRLAAADGRGWTVSYVSWDDVSRTVGSAVGPNITDTHLFGKHGERLFVLRPQNFNERVGHVSADDIAAVVGNCVGDGGLRPITLRRLLREFGTHARYAGVEADVSLAAEELDSNVSVRFQTVFLPVADQEHAKYEFQPAMYSYQTGSPEDPRNMLILCNTQGAHVQQPDGGLTKLFLHSGPIGDVQQHVMEAERSTHGVGGPQVESEAEVAAAVARGKATACVIGPRALGTRFNELMTVQVPLKCLRHEAPATEPAVPFVCQWDYSASIMEDSSSHALHSASQSLKDIVRTCSRGDAGDSRGCHQFTEQVVALYESSIGFHRDGPGPVPRPSHLPRVVAHLQPRRRAAPFVDFPHRDFEDASEYVTWAREYLAGLPRRHGCLHDGHSSAVSGFISTTLKLEGLGPRACWTPWAMYELGVDCEWRGRLDAAWMWYFRAGEHRHPEALHMLGVLVEQGHSELDHSLRDYSRSAAGADGPRSFAAPPEHESRVWFKLALNNTHLQLPTREQPEPAAFEVMQSLTTLGTRSLPRGHWAWGEAACWWSRLAAPRRWPPLG